MDTFVCDITSELTGNFNLNSVGSFLSCLLLHIKKLLADGEREGASEASDTFRWASFPAPFGASPLMALDLRRSRLRDALLQIVEHAFLERECTTFTTFKPFNLQFARVPIMQLQC